MALPAGEVPGIALEALDADLPQHRLGFCARPAALGHDLPDRHARVERALRVLEDHVHALLPRHRPRRRLRQPREQLKQRGFAGAGTADDAEALALADGEGDVVQRGDPAVGLGYVLKLDDGLAQGGHGRRGEVGSGELTDAHDAVAHALDDVPVMANKQQRSVFAVRGIHDGGQDFLLGEGIQGGGWLIADEELGMAGHGHLNERALALPAGELVREAVEAGDLHQRVERGHGFLEDHGQRQLAQVTVAHAQQLLAVEADGSGGLQVVGQQPHDG